MQISAISPSFQGRRDNVDALISMDDSSIREIAKIQTESKIDRKKNRKVTNALFYSAPLAAGLAVAVLGGGHNSKIFSKEVTGLAARASRGLKTAAIWTAALGAVDALGFAHKKLSEKSTDVSDFNRNHPFLTMGAMLAAGIAAIIGVNKAAARLGRVEAPKFLGKVASSVDKFLNNNGTVQSAKRGLLKLADKTPSALKEIGATALDWAPTVLLFGGLFHSLGSASRENREYAKNYTDLRNRQSAVAQARVRELAMQNDFLMQDARNKENLELVQEPLGDLPEEVVEAVEELHSEEV